jgi:hypothetical protein
MDFFGMDEGLNHDALDDARDLLSLVRCAKPEKERVSWYTDFLMSSYKPVSYFL